MATFADKKDALDREPIWLLKIYIDSCGRYNPAIGSGNSNECSAASPCHYSWFTCQDQDEYERVVTLPVQFCNEGAKVIGARPLLDYNFNRFPTKINEDSFETEVGELLLTLSAAEPTYLANPDKMDYSQEDYDPTWSAKYWPMFMARNPNFKNRIAELYYGFDGVDPSNFQLTFRGVIHDMDWGEEGSMKVTVRDLLSLASENQLPSQIPSDVYITDDPLTAGAVTINLNNDLGGYDATKDFEAATAEQPRCVLIGGTEYVTYTGITVNSNGSELTGCTRGAYGTTAAEHASGTALTQVVVYANDDDSNWDDCTGVLADHAFMDMICFYAGVDQSYIETYDPSVTLNGAIGTGDTTISVSSSIPFPESGVIKIGNEFILYNGLDGNDLMNCKRGMYGTAKASHLDTTAIYLPTITKTLGDWRGGDRLVKNRIESEFDAVEKIQTLRSNIMFDVWVNESGKIECKLQAPPILGEAYTTYTEQELLGRSRKVKRNEVTRLTRLFVWYNPVTPDPITSNDDKDAWKDYQYSTSYIGANSELVNAYGEVVRKTLHAEWLYRFNEAHWLASHYYTKYVDGTPIVIGDLELRDDIAVGDLVALSIPEVVDSNGTKLTKFYNVIYKRLKEINEYAMQFAESGFGGLKYGVIGPENGLLDSGISDVDVTIDIDLSGTDLTVNDFRTGATHQIRIEDEEITYTTATDLSTSYEVVRLTGVTRGVNGTSNVAHAASEDVLLLYSGQSNMYRERYASIGSTGDPDTGGNLLDSNGDFTEETNGYRIY